VISEQSLAKHAEGGSREFYYKFIISEVTSGSGQARGRNSSNPRSYQLMK
jgi:hypothetical protein